MQIRPESNINGLLSHLFSFSIVLSTPFYLPQSRRPAPPLRVQVASTTAACSISRTVHCRPFTGTRVVRRSHRIAVSILGLCEEEEEGDEVQLPQKQSRLKRRGTRSNGGH